LMAYDGQRGEAWREWRQALRDKIWELLGMERHTLEVADVERIRTDLVSGVERTKIILPGSDGLRLPAYVMVPAEIREPLPALLVYPGTGTIRQTAGLERSARSASALALAQAGYVTITVEQRGYGELAGADHNTLDNVARLIGRSWLGMAIEDGLRALDYLQGRPDVKPDHLGITGLGLGGGLALYTAALDERVRALVVENFLGGERDPGILMGQCCHFVPGLRRYAELSDVARLVVPRPALYAYPKGYAITQSARQMFDQMRMSYEAFKCPDRTRFVEHDNSEPYGSTGARAWFDRWLVEEEETGVLLWAPREE
jgi:hypothetical protein